MPAEPGQPAQPTISVRIPTEHGGLKAALALPADTGSIPSADATASRQPPGIIVLHELFGLNDDIRSITARFADNGYAALAPDLYSLGPPLKPICIWQTMNNLRRGSGRAFDAIESCRVWLASRAEVDESRLAVAGFCMGGGFAMLYAARAPLGAAAVFYGQAPRRAERLDGICPTFAAYGEHDHIADGHAELLRGHLDTLGVEHEVVLYPDAGHSFMNQYDGLRGFMVRRARRTIGYHEASAESAWASMLEFFVEHLGGTSDPSDASEA